MFLHGSNKDVGGSEMEIVSQDYLFYDILGLDDSYESFAGLDEIQVCAGTWRRLGFSDNWYFERDPEWDK